jgi:cyclohexanone monooxygenase
VAANTTAMLEQQAEHIAYIVSEALKRGASTVETSQEAQDAWIRTIRETSVDTSAFDQTCTPGYYNNEGGGGGEGIRSHLGEPYAPGFYLFDDLLKTWRDKGDLDGLVLGT